MNLSTTSAHTLSQAIASKQLSCRELMQATLARIAQVNPAVNAIVSLRSEAELLADADTADAQIARGESRGWLHGIPQAIKDLALTQGLRTTLGSPLKADFVPTQDALMVQRMKAAGCIVIGKTNVPEFGLGSHTFNEVFGPTRNPYGLAHTAGGSSGGAAAALATGMLAVADGSDFMGSLRNPAAWNNIFGLRPSQGRVPMWPADEVFTSQLATEGPMARNVRDLALLLQTQSGWDARVPLSIAKAEDFVTGLEGFAPKQCRIAWLGDMNGYLACEPGVTQTCEDGLARLAGIGGTVEPATLGFSAEAVWEAWLVWRAALVASRIAPHLRSEADRALTKPEALWEHDSAQSLTGAKFLHASTVRSGFYQHMLRLLSKYECIALPCAQVWPFEVNQRWPQHITTGNGPRTMDTYHRWMECTIYATFAGLPAISLPCGFNAAGLPMGVQIVGRPQGEAALLQLAYAYEQAAQSVLAVRPALVR